MKKLNWLNRELITGPYFVLVLSEAEYHRAMDDFKHPKDGRPAWIKNAHSNATVHILEHENGGLGHIVAVRGHETRTGIEIAGLLVHEAVHIFQNYCENIGEHSPSHEFEAYSIQHIAQQLMSSYTERGLAK